MRLLFPLGLAVSLATGVVAQDRPNTILVIDGSGSMWGQIDGVAKITIAQDVVAGLLEDFPADQGLGLTVYGHRERGSCTDIETVVAPAAGTASQIVSAVNGIKPLGKTPMTDAVIAAAEALRYTEDSATVILVSDGVETCNPDPCAAARLLEEAGINFTAHVVGFDITDPDALAQMQCIADETGGRFLTAANAAELDLAMASMVMEPAPIVVTGTFEARLAEVDGPLITDPIIWDISSDSDMIADDMAGNPVTVDLLEGMHRATAYRITDEIEAEATFTVSGPDDVTVVVVFPDVIPAASIEAVDSAPVGATIPVTWTGPDGKRDYIAVSEPDESGYVNYTYTEEGNPLDLRLPVETGTYELRYFDQTRDAVIATRSIEITPVDVTIDAPETAIVGESIAVNWTGPGYERDYISVGEPGKSQYINYTYTDEGNALTLTMPTEPGTYDIRYQLNQRGHILATRSITVSAAVVTLEAPQTAIVGESITVGWTGPDYNRDYISVGEIGANQYINYTYTENGNPLSLVMPTEPGDYEIRYQLSQGAEILAVRPITVTEATVSLDAPAQAAIASEITVNWTGPGYNRDYISVGKPGEQAYINYTYTDEGNPLTLTLPPEAGDYEIRYQLSQGAEILMTRPITVTALKIALDAPESALAGETIQVSYDGPDYARDYIAVSEVGDSGYINYTYTESGNPVALELPPVAGTYELRYILAQGATVAFARPITVTEVKAQLVGPATIALGETLLIGWDGPDYAGDYITIAQPDDDGYIDYTRTESGNPVELRLPETAGTYEVRYVMRQDGTIIARMPLEVTK